MCQKLDSSIPGELKFSNLTSILKYIRHASLQSLYAVLLNIIIFIQLSLCLVSTTSFNSRKLHMYSFVKITRNSQIPTSLALSVRHALAILAPFFVYSLLSSYAPVPDRVVSSGTSGAFALVIACYNVFGVFIPASLSGFGSVTTA